MVDGDSYADIVTWVWNRAASTWSATLKSGHVLLAIHFRRQGKGRSHWQARVELPRGKLFNETLSDTTPFANADQAQNRALGIYLARKKEQP